MKADTLHEHLVNLLTGYYHYSGYYVHENDETFSYIEKILLNANTKTRKVLLHWLKGYKNHIALCPLRYPNFFSEIAPYLQHPKATFDQMIDHLEHLNYAQKIKASVNYDPLSYPTHYDCLSIVNDYPIPVKPISPNKFPYLRKVAEMFDDDDNCYTVYRFLNRKKNAVYESPKEAFITLMRSHFGKHAMPWCICTDSPRNFWDSNNYSRKYLVFKNNKLYAAAASGYGYSLILYDRTNKTIGTLYLPGSCHKGTKYRIRFSRTTKEDELKFTSAAASVFNPPTIPGCTHRSKPTDILVTTPFRHLCANEKGLQWISQGDKKTPTKQDLPSYSVVLNGEYTIPSTKLIRYKVNLTVDNNKDTPLHIITKINLEEIAMKFPFPIVAEHEYDTQMTKEKAASLIEQHVKESLARTPKEPSNE